MSCVTSLKIRLFAAGETPQSAKQNPIIAARGAQSLAGGKLKRRPAAARLGDRKTRRVEQMSHILRSWNGRAAASNAAAYPRHFTHDVLPELRRIDGFLGADLLRRELGDAIEYRVLTRWASMSAIAAFAGSDPGRAVVTPDAVAALTSFDPRVEHFEILAEERRQ
jgi:heme-degrading monooxygenase HmoA